MFSNNLPTGKKSAFSEIPCEQFGVIMLTKKVFSEEKNPLKKNLGDEMLKMLKKISSNIPLTRNSVNKSDRSLTKIVIINIKKYQAFFWKM